MSYIKTQTYQMKTQSHKIEDLKLWYDRKRIDLNMTCQRNTIWKDNTHKQALIDTLVFHEHIPECHVIKETQDPIYYVIDGKQRLSTIFDFLDDKLFWLRKSADPQFVSLFGSKQKLLFSELPKNLQAHILDKDLLFTEYNNMTAKGISKLFCKLNSGVPLSKYQRGIASNILYRTKFADKLINHPSVPDLFTYSVINSDQLESMFIAVLTLMLAADSNDGQFYAVDIFDERIFAPYNPFFPNIETMTEEQIAEWSEILEEKANILYDYLTVLGEASNRWTKKKSYRGQIIYPFIVKYVKNISNIEFVEIWDDFFSFSTSKILTGGSGQPFAKKGVKETFEYIESMYF